ncbi:DNA replication regulator SLD3-domain-containing protein [Xylariomycetidae sp. FL0641]|nr:DNA replication regulator SLD3-domain-containing protein [Xylariomycetidae sp. FL0641]
MLLPREHFQLSFLDLSMPYGSFESSPRYESNVKILELEGRMSSRPVLLLARLETDKTTYAIELQKNGLYTLCHVGAWVDLEALCAVATVSCPHLVAKCPPTSTEFKPQPVITPQAHHDFKKRKIAIEAIQSLVKKPTRVRSVSTAPVPSNLTKPPTPAPDRENISPKNGTETQTAVPDEDVVPPTAESIFEHIRSQYTESLYHSMGSLAYFAKGPLSRAHAAFRFDCDSKFEMNDLIDFLKGLVMTANQLDKKYREAVPDVISKMKTTFDDSDASPDHTKSKKRKPKKMRLGRNGMYPNEDEHVRKWWTVHKPRPNDDDDSMITTDSQNMKLQISCLRSRETQLQMIIILEILSLEPLRTPEENAPQLPEATKTKVKTEEASEALKQTSIKKRNKHNLPLLLELLADRLCIWQATALDDIIMLENARASMQPESQKSLRASSDPLKDFCIDIIVPFYSARLPDKCDSINKKLGGPVMASPPKPKAKKVESKPKPKPKPGAAAKRPAPPKSARTLERELSKESERHRRSVSRGPGGMIALMRSASTPTIPYIKRETSDTGSLANIPRKNSITSHERAPLLSGPGAPTKRSSRDDKVKKDAYVQAELRDAITSLRRPNRDVVGKAMAEAAERRATTSLSQLKKSKKPTQHPAFQNIIKATPVNNRFRDALSRGSNTSTSRHYSAVGMRRLDDFPVPSSTVVPSSAPRKRNRDTAFSTDDVDSPALPVLKAPRRADVVEATPLRRPPPPPRDAISDEAVVLASSPVMARKSAAVSFPHHDSGIGMSPSSPAAGRGTADVDIELESLAETPMKPRRFGTLANFVTVTPAKQRGVDKVQKEVAQDSLENTTPARTGNGEQKLSLFERLGWDDYDDIF